MNELIDQCDPLFIGNFLNSEVGYEHDEVGNRARQIEKHLEPPLISSSNRYAGDAVRFVFRGYRLRRQGRLKDRHSRA